MKLASVELSERSMRSVKLRGEQSVMKLMWPGMGSFVSSLCRRVTGDSPC